MDRRQMLAACAGALLVLRGSRVTTRQASAYVSAVEAAFARWKDVSASEARIAAAGEPGTPLIINGTLFEADETTPCAGALVFAYHTDAAGLYSRAEGPHQWRLQGAARTDREGRFRFTTVRPAPYPGRTIPAHVHLEFQAKDARYHGGEIRFADDALVDASERSASSAAGRFAWVLPSTSSGAAQTVTYQARLRADQRF